VRRFSGSACNKGSGYSLTRPYSVAAANVRAGHHDWYVHCGNVHENKPSSPSDGYFRRLLTTHSGAGRSDLGYPHMAGERARSGRRGADKL